MNREIIAPSPSKGPNPFRVLMAVGDASLLGLDQERLARQGFEPTTAASGLECVARLRECVPDVLVLEPEIPWGGGDGVLAIMGETPHLADVPVMLLASRFDLRVLDRVARFPINDYCVTPLSPSQLARRLRTILTHPRLRFTLAEQCGRLECSIARRTDGRIRNLRVAISDSRIIVCGCSESHYVKQLVLAAVLEAIEASELQSRRVDLEIEVCGDCPSTIPTTCFNSKGTQELLRWNVLRDEDSQIRRTPGEQT